jgi:hypothetical protein
MNKEIIKSLKEALAHLRAEENEKARSLLVKILKQEPENDQAWFLLSFSVAEEDRQLHAVEKAILFNPNSKPARTRLALLKGEPKPVFEDVEDEAEIEYSDKKGEVAEKEHIYVDTAEENDLLSQRLFDAITLQEEKIKSEVQSGLNEDKNIEIKNSSFIAEKYEEDGSDFEEGFGGRKKLKVPRITPMGRNIWIVSIMGIILIGGLIVMMPRLNALSTATAPAIEEFIIPTATETPNIVKTVKITFTATIEFKPSSTRIPLATPVPATVSPDILEIIPAIQSDIESVRGLVPSNQPIISMESNENMENIIRRMASGLDFDTETKDGKSLYLALGLMNSSTGYVDYMRNHWGDPGIGLYLPDNDLIAFTGFRFGVSQKYLYALEYTKLLIEHNYETSQYNIVPTCTGDIQNCQVWTSLVKGDAMFTTSAWLDAYGSIEEKDHVDNMFIQYFLLPVQGATSFILEDIKFPYLYGEAFVKHLYSIGGWASVDLAYYIPPTTTEQILHPEKFINAEPAILLEDPSLDSILENSWINTYNGSIGEWTTYLMLAYPKENISGGESPIAEYAAAGWGGDHIQVYRDTNSSKNILAGHWVWDTPEDAIEFLLSLEGVLQTRYSSVVDNSLIENHSCWESFSEFSCIKYLNNHTLLITAPTLEKVLVISNMYEFNSDSE